MQELNISHIGEILGKEKFPSVTSVQNQHVLLLEKDTSTFPQIGSGEIQAQGTWEGCCPNTLHSKTEKTFLLQRQKAEKLLKRTDIFVLHFALWRPVAFSREKHFPVSLAG